jgi:hypothetical protein
VSLSLVPSRTADSWDDWSASSKFDGAACSKKWVQGVRAVEGHLVVGFKSKRHQIQPPRMHGFEIDSHADVLYIHVGKSRGGTIRESLDKMGVIMMRCMFGRSPLTLLLIRVTEQY